MRKLIRGRREVGKRVGSTASHWLMLMLPIQSDVGERIEGESKGGREGNRVREGMRK